MRAPWRRTPQLAPWPVVLRDRSAEPAVVLRPLRVDDEEEWHHLRRENADHVRPWEPTLPPGARTRPPTSYRQFVADLDREAAADRAMPWCIEVDGRIVGQVHLFGVARAAQQSAAAGYWLAESASGQGIATRALALALDHALGPAGLHRVEVNIRLDNARSLALVRRLRLREEGVRERYLHIDGAWRDHLSFAVTVEDLQGETLLSRLSHL
ncbi:GNAT family N-acetyltransferase [Intrasporangium calvum]|uniref:GNAT family N-acetyltransferase n=1 Tax=Intrasporangium calvum TaxID=53358 RepID=A0ABT5GJZ9_9MICO|nr:GNAT family protein [Intrasporangium calvum]MDC5698200.1 GNAT family N-acetyltransferase [Intrasporangium calvum]